MSSFDHDVTQWMSFVMCSLGCARNSSQLQRSGSSTSPLYADDVGGFRHSDTVVVTADGIDILTDYPSDIESLTLPV